MALLNSADAAEVKGFGEVVWCVIAESAADGLTLFDDALDPLRPASILVPCRSRSTVSRCSFTSSFSRRRAVAG
jgi:hypothetical protein